MHRLHKTQVAYNFSPVKQLTITLEDGSKIEVENIIETTVQLDLQESCEDGIHAYSESPPQPQRLTLTVCVYEKPHSFHAKVYKLHN